MRLSSLIGHCAEAMELIVSETRPADRVINYYFRGRKYLGSRDRAFIAEGVYHALRHRRRLEWLAAHLRIAEGAPEVKPEGRSLVTFALSLLEGVETDEARRVAEALAEREEFDDGAAFVWFARKFLNDVDSLPWPDDAVGRLAIEHSMPDWLMRRFADALGVDEAGELAEFCNHAAPVTLRVNDRKAPREAVQATLEAEGHPCDPTPISPFGLTLRKRANVFTTDTFKRGWFDIQDEGSQLVALCVDPKPGSRVLDACSGGGGKALHMSAIMKGRGEIQACDIHKRRLDSLKDRARRNDCQNIRIRLLEAEGAAPDDMIDRMDYVLVDAPCTGVGVLRRNPDARWKVTPESVEQLTAVQGAILDRYAACVRPGGRLVYATCSTLEEENEDVIRAFFERNDEFEPSPLRPRLERYGLAHLVEGDAHMLRLWPHRDGTDGFFVASLERKA